MADIAEIVEFNESAVEITAASLPLHLGGFRLTIKFFNELRSRHEFHTAEHAHPVFELAFVRDGMAEYHMPGKIFPLLPGEGIMLIPPGVDHSRWISSGNVKMFLAHLDLIEEGVGAGSKIAGIKHLLSEKSCFFTFQELGIGVPAGWLQLMHEHPPLWKERAVTMLQDFITSLFAAAFADVFVTADHDLAEESGHRIHGAVKKINEMMNRKGRVADYISELEISERQFRRISNKLLGMPPVRFVAERKMDTAKQLLSTGDSSIKEVAALLGYSDPGYFSRLFRRKFGLSPREYAAKNRKPTGNT